MKIKNLIIITSVILTFISCNKDSGVCDVTYFGGQIINPKQKFITLSKNNTIVDTIYLDAKNNFITQLDIDAEGLYSFNYGLEYQYVYFEPRDSILIRLNAWDFDESLVFSGRGSEKNNFLITLYLQNEKDELSFSPYYNLDSKMFEEKIAVSESLNNHLYELLKESGIEISNKFDELSKIAISYPLYRRKEIYPLIHKNRYQLEHYPTVSNTYYDFRKNIDLNNENLINFAPYHSYINSYLYALTYRQKKKNSNFTVDLLNIINENIKIDRFKDGLLRQAIYNDFRKSRASCTINKKALEIFNKNCSNERYLKQINALANDCQKIKQNSNLDNFKLTSIQNQELKINSIIENKKAVIYFWSPIIISPDMLIKKVKYLEKKYPELLFIGINMDPTQHSNRVNQLLTNQYTLPKNSSAHNFVSSLEPRTILINHNGIVSNSFTYLSSPHLERQLTNLENN